VGFFLGVTNPSRDSLVRQLAPAHLRGRVYGFVYSGLDAGAAIAPAILGWLLDRQLAQWVFGGCALCMLVAAPTVLEMPRRMARAAPSAK
jgi:MFS family permease